MNPQSSRALNFPKRTFELRFARCCSQHPTEEMLAERYTQPRCYEFRSSHTMLSFQEQLEWLRLTEDMELGDQKPVKQYALVRTA